MSTPFISTLSVENAHRSDVYAVGTCVRFTVAASGDGIISLWDNQSPSETLTALNQTPVPSGIHHMAVDDAGYVVAVAFDGSVLAFDLKSQEPLQLSATANIRGAWGCALSGTHAAISTLQGTVYVVDLASDSLVVELSEPTSSASGKAQPCLCVDISSDAKFVVGGYESGKTRVFSVDTGRIAYTLPTHIPRPRCVKFNRQVSMLAVTGNESIALYTLTGGSYLGSLLGHESYVYSIDFESSGERLLSVAGDGKLKVWSLDLREAVFTITDTDSPLFAGAWVPERTNVIAGAPAGFVTAGVDRTIRWYREASGSANDL